MTRVAVVGHVEWVDFIAVAQLPSSGEIEHAHGAFARAAGGGGVVAAVLAELGAEVDFFCALGDDADGHRAANELSSRGVRLHAAWRGQPTRRAVTMLDDGGERTIVTMGERLEPLGEDELDWDRLAHAEGVYFTAGDGAALQLARAARVVVASPRGREALQAGPEIDALVYSGQDRDESRWAGRLADHARLMVETQGRQGGRWRGSSEGRWEAVPLAGPLRDTYGAGDSFAAGFTYVLASGGSVAEAARLGAECGACALTRPGAP